MALKFRWPFSRSETIRQPAIWLPMARVPYLNSLSRLANADGVQGNARSPYHDDFVTDRIERALEEQMQARVSSARLPRVERSQSMLYAAQLNSKALQRVTPYIPKSSPKERLSRQADIALASFKAGVCVSANLSIGQFDSHANNDPDQMKLIPEFLAGIDYLVTKSEELKIRDKLVVIIQSEMGRTPTYNKGNGKDHWSIGSIMFMGHGIQGNRVIGATDEKQFLVPIESEFTGNRRRKRHSRSPGTHSCVASRIRRNRRPRLQQTVSAASSRRRTAPRPAETCMTYFATRSQDGPDATMRTAESCPPLRVTLIHMYCASPAIFGPCLRSRKPLVWRMLSCNP